MLTYAQKHQQSHQANPVEHARPGIAAARRHEVHPILQLQYTIGNQAVQRLLQPDAKKLEAGLTGTASPYFERDFSQVPIHTHDATAIQTRLAISKQGDEYEQEAERVSEQLMRMPEPQLQPACACGGRCPKCQTAQKGQQLARLQTQRVNASDSGLSQVPPIVHEVLRSPGQPLDLASRAFMEPRFGHDFSHVRVHTDADAAESARSVSALAYTVGTHVVFGEGQYSPNSRAGRQLLAHELTHVAQQGDLNQARSRIQLYSQMGELGNEANQVFGQAVNFDNGAHPLRTQRAFTTRLQRQPGRQKAGTRQATVDVRWSEDSDKFYDRLVAALVSSPGFHGIDTGNFRSAGEQEAGLAAKARAFHTQYGMHHSDRKEGGRIKVHVSADFNPSQRFHDTELTDIRISGVERSTVDQAGQKGSGTITKTVAEEQEPTIHRTVPKPNETPAERVQREASETAGHMASLLLRAYKSDHAGVALTVEFDGRGVLIPSFEASKAVRERKSGEVPLSYAKALRVTKDLVDDLVFFGPGSLELIFSFEGGLNLERWTRHAPGAKPDPAEAGTGGDREDTEGWECDQWDSNYGKCLAEQRTAYYREGILAAEEVFKEFYDPMSGGPVGQMPKLTFKLVKEGWAVYKIGRRAASNRRTANALRREAREVFFRANPHLVGKGIEIHHRIPLEYRHLFPDADPNRLSNLQGLTTLAHRRKASDMWDAYRNAHRHLGVEPTAKSVLNYASMVDTSLNLPYPL